MADAGNSTILPKAGQVKQGSSYGYPSARGNGNTNPKPSKGSPVNSKSAK